MEPTKRSDGSEDRGRSAPSLALTTVCPLCSSAQVREILAATGWAVWACDACTNAWTVPPPREIAYNLEDWHSQFDYRSIDDLPPAWRSALLKQVVLITGALRPGGRILEIGCGQGLLLSELRRRGFAVVGIEPSFSASRIAVEAGLDVRSGYFPEAAPEGPFDAVIMSHVLEHLERPHDVVRQLQGVSPGAIMLFVQSNWQGLLPRRQGAGWHAWVPEQHFWHFTPKGLGKLIELQGWRVLKTQYSGLDHGGSLLSKAAAVIPRQGDQFHLLARIGS